MTQFTELGLAEPILKALGELEYTTPTPIQTQAIPVVMAGSDLLGIAQTGTGKTAAFALPILHRLASDQRAPMPKGCRVLVLTPTRELASQIADNFRAYGRHMRLSVAVIVGGVAHRPQIHALARGVDVLIATPGRLLDHVAERNVLLHGTEILVLDEADQMLDLGFVKPIRRIVKELTVRRQTLFFSATMPNEIAELVKDFLRDPVRVAVTPVATTAERVAQRVIHIESKRKPELLSEMFADAALSRVLVFTRTKRGADRVTKHLEKCGIDVSSIHGNKSQRQREIALDMFRRSKIRVLVATDIAARGIDVDDVSHVVNYELPDVPEAYVHRIGRTARAGASGSAISFCDIEERDRLRAIERLTRQSIPHEDRRQDTSVPLEVTPRPVRGSRRGNTGGRPPRDRSGEGRSARTGDGARPPRKWRDGAEGGRGEHRRGREGASFNGRDRHSEAGSDAARASNGARPRREHGEAGREARSGDGARERHSSGPRGRESSLGGRDGQRRGREENGFNGRDRRSERHGDAGRPANGSGPRREHGESGREARSGGDRARERRPGSPWRREGGEDGRGGHRPTRDGGRSQERSEARGGGDRRHDSAGQKREHGGRSHDARSGDRPQQRHQGDRKWGNAGESGGGDHRQARKPGFHGARGGADGRSGGNQQRRERHKQRPGYRSDKSETA
ncbi:DEAD/DEAH box helicase [Leptospira interrogans]